MLRVAAFTRYIFALALASLLPGSLRAAPLTASTYAGTYTGTYTGMYTGTYTGTATYRDQHVPLSLEIGGKPGQLHAALINGSAAHATGLDRSAASGVTLEGNHLTISFDYFDTSFDLTAAPDGHLAGTFGPAAANAAARIPVELGRAAPTATVQGAPNINGSWEVAVHSPKGETAWQLLVSSSTHPGEIRAVMQRIDGDTGSLFGRWDGTSYLVSHFNPDGPTLWSITPHAAPDGMELVLTNRIASEANRSWQTELVARRPAEARKLDLPAPTRSTDQTHLKHPSEALRFSGKTPDGKVVDQSDPSLRGKVVIVTVGGSWCPNCHDEAPFLESLYKRFHAGGLEIIDLSFEDGEQFSNPTRLRAFTARYGLTYPVLLAGHRDDLNQVVPDVDNLNSWPTSFFIGRNGRVEEIHAGFAGPANPEGNAAIREEITHLVERLLSQQNAASAAPLSGGRGAATR